MPEEEREGTCGLRADEALSRRVRRPSLRSLRRGVRQQVRIS